MTTTDFCLLIVAAFIFLYPQDSINIPKYIVLWTGSRILNFYLMFRAYLMYRRLTLDMGKMGVTLPAFKFVPIWERHGINKKNDEKDHGR